MKLIMYCFSFSAAGALALGEDLHITVFDSLLKDRALKNIIYYLMDDLSYREVTHNDLFYSLIIRKKLKNI